MLPCADVYLKNLYLLKKTMKKSMTVFSCVSPNYWLFIILSIQEQEIIVIWGSKILPFYYCVKLIFKSFLCKSRDFSSPPMPPLPYWMTSKLLCEDAWKVTMFTCFNFHVESGTVVEENVCARWRCI